MPAPIVNGGEMSFWKWISNFQGLVTLTLDRFILHTVVHQSSTSTYTRNYCIEIKETFCGRTDVRMYTGMDGWTFEMQFIKSTQKGRPKKCNLQKYLIILQKQIHKTGQQWIRNANCVVTLHPVRMWILYVCPHAYIKKHTSKFHQIFYTCYLWPWLSPPVIAMQYDMFFKFCGWCHFHIMEQMDQNHR